MAEQSLNADGFWLSMTDLAKARGVSKPAISQNLRDWRSRGIEVSTRKDGRQLLINVAEYDAARGEVGNQSYTQEAERDEPQSKVSTDPVFAREQAREKGYSADLKKLSLAKELRSTVAIDRAEDELAKVAEPIIKAIDRLPTMADEVAAAISRDGVQGVRNELKIVAAELRNLIADGLTKLVADLRSEPRRALADFDPTGTVEPAPP
jgi:biotin operon repressor